MQSFFSETPDNSPAPLLSTHRLDPTVLYNRIWQKNHLNSTLLLQHGGFYSFTKTNPSPPCLVQKIRLVHKSWTWCVWVSPFTRLLCFLLCLWNITTALVALQWRFSVLEKKSIKLEVELQYWYTEVLIRTCPLKMLTLQLCGWWEAQSVSITVTWQLRVTWDRQHSKFLNYLWIWTFTVPTMLTFVCLVVCSISLLAIGYQSSSPQLWQ